MNSEGKCEYCKELFSATAMTKHLLWCVARKKKFSDKGNHETFLMMASSGPFFVYFEVDADATLEKIDEFLRVIWFEYEHLSAFTIENVKYNSKCNDSEQNLNHKLSNILDTNSSFSYEYDFGTPTKINLKVLQKRIGSQKRIEVIARNNPPEIKCRCGNRAKTICSKCIWEKSSLFCFGCAKNHICGEEKMLPVVNSPRMGMCGYMGDGS